MKDIKDGKEGKEIEYDDEQKCIKQWRLYDDVFHFVFFNTSTKKLIIKKKTDIDTPA